MTILATGGAGHIGSHTAKLLARCGHTPVVYDNLSRGNPRAVRWGPLIRGELADTKKLTDILREHRVHTVLHFAANAYVGESMTAPGTYFRNNVAGTLSLLEAMTAAGTKRLVVSSTCAVYGTPALLPITEETPLRPVNVYGETKVMMEQMIRWYQQLHGLRAIILRYFNAAGADPDGDLGECHDPETHLVPIVIRAALGQGPAVRVFGTDYDTPDGTCVRDYIHVHDLADAHLRALALLEQGGESAIFNLGCGKGHSVLEIIRAVEKTSGREVPRQLAHRRPGDPPVLVADAGRARDILGWKPEYSDLQTIVATACRWHEKNG